MKKYLALFVLLTTMTPVLAESYFEPQWNEFCPSQYTNLDPEKSYKLAEKKYWQARKKEFDKKISYCNQLGDKDKTACYDNLRVIEGNATATHLEEVRIQQQETANAVNMMNAVNYQVNTTNHIMNNTYNPYRY